LLQFLAEPRFYFPQISTVVHKADGSKVIVICPHAFFAQHEIFHFHIFIILPFFDTSPILCQLSYEAKSVRYFGPSLLRLLARVLKEDAQFWYNDTSTVKSGEEKWGRENVPLENL
jgi:hypothetical protein